MVLALVTGNNVPGKMGSPSRSVATALHLAGVRALARVRAGMVCEGTARCRSVATALHLAGVRALARVRPYVRVKVTARCRRVATALLLAPERALAHLEARALPSGGATKKKISRVGLLIELLAYGGTCPARGDCSVSIFHSRTTTPPAFRPLPGQWRLGSWRGHALLTPSRRAGTRYTAPCR